jgi:hypothetical protein
MTLQHVDTMIAFAMVMLLLSLLVTTLVQLFHLISFRRGRNLLWGVTELFEQSGLKEKARQVADQVLRHPSLTSNRKFLATAIRAEELARVLKVVLENDKAVQVPAALQAFVDDGGSQQASPIAASAGEDPGILKSITAAVDGSGDPDLIAAKTKIQSLVRTQLQRARALAAETTGWFNQIMDRTTERFLLQTRWVTAVMSVAVCLVFHVDAIEMLQQLSTDDRLRETLVAGAQETLGMAEEVIANQTETLAVGSAAIKAVLEEDAERDAPDRLVDDANLAKNIPSDLKMERAGEDWLGSQIQDSDKRRAILAEYQAKFGELLKQRDQEVRVRASQIMGQLEANQLVLFDVRLKGYGELPHLGGMFIAALLLGLGAPFWFNLLKNLTNLRPVIAKRVDEGTSSGG